MTGGSPEAERTSSLATGDRPGPVAGGAVKTPSRTRIVTTRNADRTARLRPARAVTSGDGETGCGSPAKWLIWGRDLERKRDSDATDEAYG
jgi:hypothetical protein